MSIETIANQVMNAIHNRDAENLAAFLAEDIVFENIPEGTVVHGKDAAFQKFKSFFDMTSKIESKIENALYNNDTAVLERKNHMCFQGKNIILPMVTLMKFKSGKITLFRDYFDAQTFSKQMS